MMPSPPQMDPRELQALLASIKEVQQMTEEDFIQKCLKDMMGGWVPMPIYLKMFSTENINKIHKRVQQGRWHRQVHYAAPDGGTAWINLPAVRLWVEGRLETIAAIKRDSEL